MKRGKDTSFGNPSLFSSTVNRYNRLRDNQGYVLDKSYNDFGDSNIESSSSFRYDAPGTGIRSTQQIDLDYSRFENHTFFNSAEVNVNVAFDKIINEFPFDGTKKQYEDFLDKLTGFEKYVFDQFPKNKGYLNFSGSWIKVDDFSGALYPTLSRDISGKSVLDPKDKSFTIEMDIWIPSQSNDNQVLIQKKEFDNQGISLFVSASSSTSTAQVVMLVNSGSHQISSSMSLQKGTFNHICNTFERGLKINKIRQYKNSKLIVTSSNEIDFGLLEISTGSLLIGSGVAMRESNEFEGFFIPRETFSGSIDELRIFHDVREEVEQEKFQKKNIFAEPDLKLYYKFNEPESIGSTSATTNSTVLDSSGNSLHSTITNFVSSLRTTGSIASPLLYEREDQNPVLFPTYARLTSLNTDLLTSASLYDSSNPNLITRLIPDHYFQEGQEFEGLKSEDGTIIDAYSGDGIPGQGNLGTSQVLSSFLYIWAKYFDELKIVLDSFGRLLHIDYDSKDSIPDQFLPFFAKYFGFDLPSLFGKSTIEQLNYGENLNVDYSTSSLTLKDIQNQIWRRILNNLQEIIQSKGTVHSVKSLIRTIGIDPDSSFRIREYGGPNKRSLEPNRELKTQITTMIDFTGSLQSVTESTGSWGLPENKPYILSQPLLGLSASSGDFIIGYPYHHVGTYTNNHDLHLTSGSFTYEGTYKFPMLSSGSHLISQSLARMMMTYIGGPYIGGEVLVSNLIAISSSIPQLIFYERSGGGLGASLQEAPVNKLIMTGVNLFDGDKWTVSFGRFRNDDPRRFSTTSLSSSYFIRASKQNFGKVIENFVTESFFVPATGSLWSAPGDVSQVCYSLVIGSQSFSMDQTGSIHSSSLSNPLVSSDTRASEFTGRVGYIKFWNKGISESEWKDHSINFNSVGVEDPLTNFGFTELKSGSWERLRLYASTDQNVTESNSSGQIKLVDFSQNNLFMTGSGFDRSKQIIKPETFYYSYLSPKIDQSVSFNKVRVRGYQRQESIQESYQTLSPIYKLVSDNDANDDPRFSIDFSIIDALNEDIISIFSSFDHLNKSLGNSNVLFSPDYPELENLRNIYFNRLTDTINLKSFFEIFKWFDSSMGYIIEQLLPRKTRFLGVNYIIEPHFLERSKYEYQFEDIYLSEDERKSAKKYDRDRDLEGNLRRF